jgi:hypothetical protein
MGNVSPSNTEGGPRTNLLSEGSGFPLLAQLATAVKENAPKVCAIKEVTELASDVALRSWVSYRMLIQGNWTLLKSSHFRGVSDSVILTGSELNRWKARLDFSMSTIA